MSLNIKDAVYGLGTKLGVDMSNAPASNIADMIDYISNGVGAHTGVIAEAVDKLEISGGDVPDWVFTMEAVSDHSDPYADGAKFTLTKTWAEINEAVSVRYKAALIRYTAGGGELYITRVTSAGQESNQYYVRDQNNNKFYADNVNDHPFYIYYSG